MAASTGYFYNMNYSPAHMYVWDPWCMAAPGGVHLYHLQTARDETGQRHENHLGHAFSADLIHWEEHSPVLGTNRERGDDDMAPWTGSAVWHEGQAYLFYTMRGSATKGGSQAVGLATSADGSNFIRYSGNPVIIPDPQRYATLENPVPGTRDCRDFHVIKAPDRPGWYGYFATRRPANDLLRTSIIAGAYSDDLIHWKQFPAPVFAPDNCGCIEVPNVFKIGDLWYITCLTGLFYGAFTSFSDESIYNGTIYAVSDSPRGPFRQLKDNVLLGARTAACPLALHHLIFDGEDYLLYTDREKHNHTDGGNPVHGTLATPKLLARDGDSLIVRYSPKVELLARHELPLDYDYLRNHAVWKDWGHIWKRPPVDAQIKEGCIQLSNPANFSILPLNIALESFILESEITIRDAVAAGFVLRMTEPWNADFVRVDSEFRGIRYIEYSAAEFLETRHAVIPTNRAFHLKVVVRREHTEIYLDDRLLTSFARYRGLGGGLGLFVDRGTAIFRYCRIRELA